MDLRIAKFSAAFNILNCPDIFCLTLTFRMALSEPLSKSLDNLVERFFRSLKYDYVYLHPANDGLELYQGVKEYIQYYNHTRHHQGIGRKIPASLYKSVA